MTAQVDGVDASASGDWIGVFNGNGDLVGRGNVKNFFRNGIQVVGATLTLRAQAGSNNCPTFVEAPELTVQLFDASSGNYLLAGNSVFIAVNDNGEINGPDGTGATADNFNFLTASLPVTLQNFNANTVDRTVALSWATSQETDNSHFEVERSANPAEGFTYVGKVLGNETTDRANNYAFVDNNPAEGMNYYRLKQVDFSGSFEYSSIVVAELEQAAETSVSVFPNPTASNGRITIRLNGGWAKGATTLNLYDASGRQVAQWQQQSNGSLNTELPALPAGLYQLVASDGQARETARVLVR
ncbi:T9SS type A sorting domain-containing protein [Neolewinella lacunae]|uniref:T9SS type A sorting domain-containing protein n=1 Tax=Neolewinella lacunae TaxID=1517758 RepID=UPI001CA3F1DA|nr:T9SS type A sorting domain-containing protein [Neolewinella lacunae]MDN3633135.1 T9SS type A sorting domain-containing protein [Neolewinella lacunae]